jgi:CHAT domain-containing protein/tetratricopeptide (TPR) repeat protein
MIKYITKQNLICLSHKNGFSLRFKLNILFFLFFGITQAQNYQKDWAIIASKLENGTSISNTEAESFIIKHKSLLGSYADNSTELYSLLASNYYDQANFDKAKENYLVAYDYSKLAKDTTLKYIAALSLAIFNQNIDSYLEAESYYLKCMAGMAAIYGQSSREYTQLFYNYTGLLCDMGKYNDAKPYVDALLYYYKTMDGVNNKKYISLLNYQAIIFQNFGAYQDAIDIYTNIINDKSIFNLGDTLGHLITLLNLGDVYREIGQMDLAISNFKQAKRLCYQYKIKNLETLATIENGLALCYKSTNNPKEAEEAYNNSLELYRQDGKTNTEPYCSVLSNKADFCRTLGRLYEASELLLTAIEIRKQRFGENTENYANAVSNLASVYFDAGHYEEALQKHLHAKEIYKLTVGENHQSYGNCLNSLSLCYLYFKQYGKAEECKLNALKIIEQSVGKNHYRYASYLISTYGLYLKTKQLDKAEKNLTEALALIEKNFGRKHDLFAYAQLALAELYTTQQKYERAEPLYFECMDYYSAQINDYFDAMNEENQSQLLSSIIPILESYNLYVINYKLNFLGKDFSNHLKRALKYQLQLKSLLANKSAQVRKEVSNSKDENIKKAYDDWILLKNKLINSFKSEEKEDENHELFKKASELELKLKSQLKTFTQEKDVTFEQLKQKLDVNEAAIEVFKVNEAINDSQFVSKYGALIIRKNGLNPDMVIFNDGTKLEEAQFENYSKCINEQILDTLSYSTYFKPLERYLKGINRIYISSDGVFHKLSFSGLYNSSTKKYLIESYDVYQTSNLGLISKEAINTSTTNLSASLFGYPDYDYDFKLAKASEIDVAQELVAKRFGLINLAKLPGTKTEVKEIANALKNNRWNTSVFIDQYASEENLRKVNSPKILHIATHGFYLKDVDSDDKFFLGFDKTTIKNNSLLRSGIILAGAGPSTQDSTNTNSENDGILTASEACLLELNGTDLVVLSACQTGLGDEMGTEGVAGLQRSFTIAGAKNIIMSLWPVDDNATQFLMTTFYKSYALTQNPETAFKLAQLEVKKKYPQPLYWAAFVLLKTFN